MPSRLDHVSRRLVFVTVLLFVPCAARAQFSVSGGIESFHWVEDTQPRKVEERGPVATLNLAWTQASAGPFRVGYRSRYYLGWVDYHGSYLFAEKQEATGTSRYAGTEQGGVVLARVGRDLDLYGGVGADWWGRTLGLNEREDFTVGFTRLGALATVPGHEAVWLDVGARFIFRVIEDAHLQNLGFDQNSMLEPRGLPNGYARVGWRVRDRWSSEAYVDGYRFDPSPSIAVTRRGEPPGAVHQPASDLRVLGLRFAYAF